MSHRPAAFVAAAAVLLAAPALATARDHAPTAAFAVTVALPPVQMSPQVYYGWLDANRAAFMARWGWNPWRVALYDGWYREHRAGLDARFAPPPRLARVHGHGRGNGWARGPDRDD
jgi:hypothetical protein